jgi:hypothetical protein
VAPGTPDSIVTDGQRLNQVLKNLLSNAVKFTAEGGVTLTVRRAESGRRFAHRVLDAAETVVAFAVQDTGIGISKDKQQLIFEAFQQADGTTSRQYGGTGLGLTISREIARLLGGEIRVESVPGQGSTFTLFLPARYVDPDADRRGNDGGAPPRARRPRGAPGARRPRAWCRARRCRRRPRPRRPAPAAPAAPAADRVEGPAGRRPGDVERRAPLSAEVPNPADDDRDLIEPGDIVVLVVENDLTFAKVLLDMARAREFRGLVALDGRTGIDLAHQYRPTRSPSTSTCPASTGSRCSTGSRGTPTRGTSRCTSSAGWSGGTKASRPARSRTSRSR